MAADPGATFSEFAIEHGHACRRCCSNIALGQLGNNVEMRGRCTAQRSHVQDRANEDGLRSLHDRVVTYHCKQIKCQSIPAPQALSNLDFRADTIKTYAHDRIWRQRPHGDAAYPRKIVMRYNYFSEAALTLFPSMLGSTIEQLRGRITQIKIDAGLSVRGGVGRL